MLRRLYSIPDPATHDMQLRDSSLCILLDRAWLYDARADWCVGWMQIHPWTIWLFWSSPLMYAMQALSVNEFTAGLHMFIKPALAIEVCRIYHSYLAISQGLWL